MGLSAGAQEELNDTVVSVNTGIYKNQKRADRKSSSR